MQINLETSSITKALESKNELEKIEISDLKAVVEKYPFFQAARVLYLNKLKQSNSFKYNQELKNTAANTRDRAILFEYITSTNFSKSESLSAPKKASSPNTESISSQVINSEPLENLVTQTKEELEVGKPIAFTNSENHSFNQWLQLSSKKPINRVDKTSTKTSKKEEIIEKFIANNPKIEPLAKDKNVSVSIAKNQQDTSLMTETLAKVYLEQKKYENAIQAYRILSLKYPEKSGFFADQIKRIQILQKHK